MFNFVHQSLTVNGIQKKIYGKVVNKVINVKFASKSVQCNSKQTKKNKLVPWSGKKIIPFSWVLITRLNLGSPTLNDPFGNPG